MKISKNFDKTKALAVKGRVERAAGQIKDLDNKDKVDLNSKTGEVNISLAEMKKLGQEAILLKNVGSTGYKHELQNAEVSFDPETNEIKNAHVQSAPYFDTSYGRGGGDLMHYEIKDKSGKVVYREKRDDYWNTNNKLNVVEVDKETGEITKFKEKEYAMTFGGALKEVFTRPAGLFLVGIAGALTGCPGTLTGTLFGPIAGVVGATATAAGLAYYKTKAW